jgi:hypothetical protein
MLQVSHYPRFSMTECPTDTDSDSRIGHAATRRWSLTRADPSLVKVQPVPGAASQTVYLVVMEGRFTLNNAPRPPRAHAPSGHYLAVTFNPVTFQVMDLGLSNQAPPASLGSLGLVSNLTQRK